MLTNIATPNLGKINISKYVVYYFKEQINTVDDCKGIEAALLSLQSKEIEKLDLPLKTNYIDKQDSLEFWVHQESSTVFLITINENEKVVSMALKANIDEFIFR